MWNLFLNSTIASSFFSILTIDVVVCVMDLALAFAPYLPNEWASQMIKNLPALWGTWVQSLDWIHPLEKGTATHSSILAWRIPWTEEKLLLYPNSSTEYS